MIHTVILVNQPHSGTFAYEGTYIGAPYSGLSRQPLLDACRQLKRMGAATTDEAQLFRPGKSDWDLRCSVGWGASRSVGEAIGTRFVKWQPFTAWES